MDIYIYIHIYIYIIYMYYAIVFIFSSYYVKCHRVAGYVLVIIIIIGLVNC